jgi:4-amino-4-deoxy-L-arabinose transferase-like glycosyltransferase
MVSPASDSSVARSSSRARSFSPVMWLVYLALLFVYLVTTGALPILGKDEPRYVEIGREMFQSRDWITPRLGGHTWFEKPILLYWMVAGAFEIFGVSEWSARLGSGLCGLGTVALIWWMVRPVNPKWANWSALSLASSLGLLVFSHSATFDIVLTFSTTLALAALFRAQIELDAKRRQKWLALFWVGTALAFLAKGLVAFLLTLVTAGIYRLLRGRAANQTPTEGATPSDVASAPLSEVVSAPVRTQSDGEWKRLGWLWGLPLCLAVSFLWYVPVTLANPGVFIHEFFYRHQFLRFTTNEFQHHQPFYFYLYIVPIALLPWTPFWVSHAWKTRLAALREPDDESRLKAFAWAWFIFPIAFFSASGSKLPSYILPALPGAFVLVGWSVARWLESQGQKSRLGIVLGLTALMLLGGSLVATTPIGVSRAERESVRTLFRAAQARGYGGLPVVHFDTLERPAQFYFAPHLMYGRDGEPLRFDRPESVAQLARRGPVLVLTIEEPKKGSKEPKKNIERLEALPSIQVERIAVQGHVALVRVSAR